MRPCVCDVCVCVCVCVRAYVCVGGGHMRGVWLRMCVNGARGYLLCVYVCISRPLLTV